MITTSQFNYIHQPKTGGTFVTDVLFQVYELDWTFWNRITILTTGKVRYNTPHGFFLVHSQKHPNIYEIPSKYADLIVLTNIRNPLDIYVSQYEFEWWKRKKYLKYYRQVNDFRKRYDKYPHLSFADFLELQYEAFYTLEKGNFLDEKAIGLASKNFLSTYTKDSLKLTMNFKNDMILAEDIRMDYLSKIHFLRTRNLNQDLYNFLKQIGFPEDKLAFILEKEKLLPMGKGRTNEQSWEKYYTPELKVLIIKKDRLLFELFPEFLHQT